MCKLLVVVDYQNDFVDGSLGFPKATKLEQGIYNKVQEYIKNGDYTVFTLDTHYDDYLETLEGKNLPIKHCIKRTYGHMIYGKLQDIKLSERVMTIEKETFGVDRLSFYEALSLDDITEIELVGVVTNICVVSNAAVLKSIYPKAEIIVDASLCASFNDELHEKALDVMESFQVKVINRDK